MIRWITRGSGYLYRAFELHCPAYESILVGKINGRGREHTNPQYDHLRTGRYPMPSLLTAEMEAAMMEHGNARKMLSDKALRGHAEGTP